MNGFEVKSKISLYLQLVADVWEISPFHNSFIKKTCKSSEGKQLLESKVVVGQYNEDDLPELHQSVNVIAGSKT